ncbi:MAG: carboxypeptidase-like regulatory domain-containing protein, partial [Flavobacteriaceae bacterium]|nr:carboxypeptidase-like regulatory domain-containing protein [Flavobacteriaceae bacterium]
MRTHLVIVAFLLPFIQTLYSQTGIVKGIVTGENNLPLEGVAISYQQKGTATNDKGEYQLEVPAGKIIDITFSHIAYKKLTRQIKLAEGEIVDFSPKLVSKTEQIDEVIVKNQKNEAEGIDKMPIQTVKQLPGANAGIENALKNIGLGVSGTNELSTQYNVRGGNYDENLVYVNGIEVYRPFLIRSGQQEGLSFLNPEMTHNVQFSAGGFQAKYGDKLSSVLDITYKKPQQFGLSLEASLLGGSATMENLSRNKKLSSIIGVRYRNNSLFVNSKDIQTNYKPDFTDVQGYLSYQLTDRFNLDFLGNFSMNNYNYTPVSRRTRFGTLDNPLGLVVYYEGNEDDKYLTLFGALKGTYLVNENLTVSVTGSAYNTREEEHYDILANYFIGEVNADFGSDNFGDIQFEQAIGAQLDHARNDLDALISNASVKLAYKKEDQLFELGAKYQIEDIRDRIIEWQVI